jgi:hypothetical protein
MPVANLSAVPLPARDVRNRQSLHEGRQVEGGATHNDQDANRQKTAQALQSERLTDELCITLAEVIA